MSTPPNPNDALIIAYLTGQASDVEVIQFQARVGADPAFRDQVERLEAWLAPMNGEADDVAPPAGLLGSIMADIDDTNAAGLSSPTGPDERPIAANDSGPLRFWRSAAIAASMIAVLSLGSHAFIGNAPAQSSDDPRYWALLSGQTPSPLVAIVYNPLTGEVVARLSNVDVPDDGDLQLWLIRDGDAAPVSLGLLERTSDGPVALSIPEELRTRTDTLALSLEVKGGSRSAGPEGPVLYTGRVSALN